MKEIIFKQISIQNISLNIRLYEMHKSHILFISDQEDMGIGTVTLATSSTFNSNKSSSTSNLLFGLKNKLITRVISEKAASALKTPVLLLFHLLKDFKEEDLVKPLMKVINDSFQTLNK